MVSSSSTLEREAKFEVDRDYDPPDFRGLVGRTERLPEQHLRTVYFDTPDRRLAARGISLRHRTTGTPEEPGPETAWTLKLPDRDEPDGGGSEFVTRSEWTWAGDRSTITSEAKAILRGVVRRAPLQPIAELDTLRRRLRLIATDNTTTVGEIDDDLVSVIGGPGDGSWFRQIELELSSDRCVEVDAILDSLRRSGAKPTKRSKLSMALGEPPSRQVPHHRRRRAERQTLSDIVTTAIASNLGRLLDHDYRLRTQHDQPNPHDIHQARVATRRLRSDLKLLAAVIDPVWLGHATDDLRWIAGVLGEIRDLDVLSANLVNCDGGRAAQELDAELREQCHRTGKKLSTALNSRRYIDLLDRLQAAAQAPPLLSSSAGTPGTAKGAEASAATALPALIGEQWRELKRQVRKADRNPSESRLHKVRIRAKRVRYAAETATPVVGKRAQKLAAGAESLQDLLGELRDSAAAETWLRRQAQERPLDTPTAFALGVLSERQHAHQLEIRERWLSEWGRLERKGNRKWLR